LLEAFSLEQLVVTAGFPWVFLQALVSPSTFSKIYKIWPAVFSEFRHFDGSVMRAGQDRPRAQQ